MSFTPPNFHLQYQDDGKGFDVANPENHKGLGMQNIESRLNMCGASITYESSIEKGVKASITKIA